MNYLEYKELLQTTQSDLFLDLPLSTQALYFHLIINEDEFGIIKNPRTIVRMVVASDDDLDALIENKFMFYCGKNLFASMF